MYIMKLNDSTTSLLEVTLSTLSTLNQNMSVRTWRGTGVIHTDSYRKAVAMISDFREFKIHKVFHSLKCRISEIG